mgnify:CR=1 FL=1
MQKQKWGVVSVVALAPLCALAAGFSASPYLAKVMALPSSAQEAAQQVPAGSSEPPAKVLALKAQLDSASQQIAAAIEARGAKTSAKAEADSKAALGSRGLTLEDAETMDEKTLMSAMTGMSFGDIEKTEGMSDEEAGAYIAAQMNAGKMKVKPLPKPSLSASPAELQQVSFINQDISSHMQLAQAKGQQLENERTRLLAQHRTAQKTLSDEEAKALSKLPEATDCGELGTVVDEQAAYAIRLQFAGQHLQAADELLRNARDYARQQKSFASEEVRYAESLTAKLASFKSELAVTMVAANEAAAQTLALGAIGSLNNATGAFTVDAALWAHHKSGLASNKPKGPCG